MAKWWTTELQNKIVDRGVQLHGGYGYMMEYPIAKAFVDTRIQTIYGGTTEIQKEIIGRIARPLTRIDWSRPVRPPVTFGEAPVSMSSTGSPSQPRVMLGENPDADCPRLLME